MSATTDTGAQRQEPRLPGNSRIVRLLVITTIVVYCIPYAPQPLLPLFTRLFAVRESDAALLITATLLPLSIAPLSYGYLLESLAAIRLLRIALLVLALSEVGFALANSFPLLLGIRFVQGLVLPAALTSIMTYMAASVPASEIRHSMSAYVAATIVGGYLGRLLSGLGATYVDWHIFFLVLAVALLLCFVGVGQLGGATRISTSRPTMAAWREVVHDRDYMALYSSIFCLFFVFASLLNFLPFRLAEMQDQPSTLLTGFIYTGYMLGVVTALGSGRIAGVFGGDMRAMRVGFVCYMATLLLMMVPQVGILFANLFVFCGAMFLVHAVAAGRVNQMAVRRRGIVNGLYVAFYYAGGVVGSYAPGFIYERFGWNAFIMTLMLVAGVGLGALGLGRGN